MVAALLHDVLDDTEVEVAEVEELFGEQVSLPVCLFGVAVRTVTQQLVVGWEETKVEEELAGRDAAPALVASMEATMRQLSTTSQSHTLAHATLHCAASSPCFPPRCQVASMVATVSQLSTTNQIVRRRLRVESAQPTKEEEAQLR